MNRAYAGPLSDEMMSMVLSAARAVKSQKQRVIRCPYCKHSALIVFEDARGHVQTKCTRCKRDVVIDVISMRKSRPALIHIL